MQHEQYLLTTFQIRQDYCRNKTSIARHSLVQYAEKDALLTCPNPELFGLTACLRCLVLESWISNY